MKLYDSDGNLTALVAMVMLLGGAVMGVFMHEPVVLVLAAAVLVWSLKA